MTVVTRVPEAFLERYTKGLHSNTEDPRLSKPYILSTAEAVRPYILATPDAVRPFVLSSAEAVLEVMYVLERQVEAGTAAAELCGWFVAALARLGTDRAPRVLVGATWTPLEPSLPRSETASSSSSSTSKPKPQTVKLCTLHLRACGTEHLARTGEDDRPGGLPDTSAAALCAAAIRVFKHTALNAGYAF